jgi:hypothetical protein
MKKIYTLFTIIFSGLSLSAQVITGIDNGDFETWTNDNKADGWGGYIDVPVFGIINTPTYVKETQNVHDMAASIQVVTSDFSASTFGLVSVLEGLAFTGAIANNAIQPLKYAGTSQPEATNLAFMYEPTNGDTAIILSYFFKWNSATNQRDTIGFGGVLLNQAVPSYLDYSYNITWQSSDIPDSMVVLLASSAGFAPQVNSKLYADNITFTFATGNKLSLNEVTVLNAYPNPAQNNATIVLKEVSDYSISLSDINGKTVFINSIKGDKTILDLSNLDSGVYFVNALNHKNGDKVSYKLIHIQ